MYSEPRSVEVDGGYDFSPHKPGIQVNRESLESEHILSNTTTHLCWK